MEWKSILLTSPFEIAIQNKITQIRFDIKTEIEKIWLKKKQGNPDLFNGCVFSVVSLTHNRITGHWTEYKNVLAQMQKTELYTHLQLRPLAVNGLIHCLDGLILGKRNSSAIYFPDYWQTPPAGSVELQRQQPLPNLIQQLYTETKEELGLTPEHFYKTQIVSATEHEHTHILDIGFFLETHLSFDEIKWYWSYNGNYEYNQLICLSPSQPLPELLLPTSHFLIRNWLNQSGLN